MLTRNGARILFMARRTLHQRQSTALIKAAVKNNPKFIEMLSKYKVDVNHRTAEAQSGEVLDATGTPVPGLGTPTDAGASAKEGFTALHVATVSCFYSKIY